MEALIHLCVFYNPVNEHFGHRFMNDSVYSLIEEMAPTCNETLSNCEWRGENHLCTNLFQPILTDRGICFTFNALNSHDIYSEE